MEHMSKMTNKRTYNVSTTYQRVSETNINWKIENLYDGNDSVNRVESPKFQLHDISDSYILLTLRIEFVPYSPNSLCFTSNFDVIFHGNVPIRHKLNINICTSNKQEGNLLITSGTYAKRNYMLLKFSSSLYDEINVKCNIEHCIWKSEITEESSSSGMSNNKCRRTNYFHESLEALFNNPMLTDTTIYVDGCKFEVHRIILAANSPVFKTMFMQNMRECYEKTIYIEDICPYIFKIFLRYMYTEEIEPSIEEEAYDLIIIADRYNVNDLKTKCIDIMKSKMNVNNVIRILNISYLIHDEDLKKYAFTYMTNNMQEVKDTKDYNTLKISNLDVLIDLVEYTLSCDI